MNPDFAPRLVWGVALLVFMVVLGVSALQKRRGGGRHRSGPGPGAAGAIYGLLSQDKRNAIEIIVEEKAAARDPEDADGNLPELEKSKRPS
jgi:hypothetical protein